MMSTRYDGLVPEIHIAALTNGTLFEQYVMLPIHDGLLEDNYKNAVAVQTMPRFCSPNYYTSVLPQLIYGVLAHTT